MPTFKTPRTTRYARQKRKTVDLDQIGSAIGNTWSETRKTRNRDISRIHSLDDLIDSGALDVPVSGFRWQWLDDVKTKAISYYAAGWTLLRSIELAISDVYQANEYVPSWNAYLFPEKDILEALQCASFC